MSGESCGAKCITYPFEQNSCVAEDHIHVQVIFDTTDAGIVLFGSAGSEVRDNYIYSKTRVVLGGNVVLAQTPHPG